MWYPVTADPPSYNGAPSVTVTPSASFLVIAMDDGGSGNPVDTVRDAVPHPARLQATTSTL